MKKSRRFFVLDDERGIALVLVLIVVFFLSAAAMAALSLTHTFTKSNWSIVEDAQCRYLAESALEIARWDIGNGKNLESQDLLFIVNSDTIGSYRYKLRKGVQDTIIAVAFIPNFKHFKIKKELRDILPK